MRQAFGQHVVARDDSARFLAISPETLRQRIARFEMPEIKESGFAWKLLGDEEYSSVGLLGRTSASAGLSAKDLVVDFPGLIEKLIGSIPHERVLLGHSAVVIETGGLPRRVAAIHCRSSAGEIRIECERCILAVGAWAPLILAQSDISLGRPLVRKKCTVITFDQELVPGITVCYDIAHQDAVTQKVVAADVSLVPFKGRTLAAGTGWTRLVDVDDPRAIRPTVEEVNQLCAELYQAFPLLARFRGTPHSCIKTELDTGSTPPNVLPQIFDESDHGVVGLTVALPGKATLMFDLAGKVLGKCSLRPDRIL